MVGWEVEVTRLTREAWLDEGLQLLKEEGAAALTIDQLTQRLGVTKGSFYHHFRSRADFSRLLLAHWEERLTHRLIEASSDGRDFSERNLKLTRMAEELFDPELEVAIRAWALRDPLAMRYQERVDRQRIDYLSELFQLVTADSEAASALALIRYAFYVGAQQIRPALSSQQYTRLLQRLQRALLASVTSQEQSDKDGG
jgi:AcrR family transcriptional regulator